MNIIQKLILDKELTSNLQVIIRDETGLYSPSNTTGYGGPNGNPLTKFDKYIFDLINLNTNVKYRQIQSDSTTTIGEYYNPSLARIVNKENVTMFSSNFNLTKFNDGLYRLITYIQFIDTYLGEGYINTDVVVNVEGATTLFNNYDGISVNGELYIIQNIIDTTLVLDRPIVTTFTSFKPILKTYTDFIISDSLNDCINLSIAKLADDCSCNKNINAINTLSEIQLYYWGIERCIETNDISQAFIYFETAKTLCSSINCNCND